MLRLDRLLTLKIIRPLGFFGRASINAIPVLMYHSISDDEETGHPYYWTNTRPQVFAEHMQFLSAHGYRTVDLQHLPRAVPDGRTVVITFDDGFRDCYDRAFPVLIAHNFSATVFLATSFVNRTLFNGKACLNWNQIAEMSEKGIQFGSHTHSHPRLWDLTRPQIAEELLQSKQLLEEKLGCEVDAFSYPFRYPEENREFRNLIGEELAKAGYRQCVTTIIGRFRRGDDLITIKRLPVNSADDVRLLDAKLKGFYDWLHTPQYVSKTIRSFLD